MSVKRLYENSVIDQVTNALVRYKSMLSSDDYSALSVALTDYKNASPANQAAERVAVSSLEAAINLLLASNKVYSVFVAHQLNSWLPKEDNSITTATKVSLCTTSASGTEGVTVFELNPVSNMRKAVYDTEVKACTEAALTNMNDGETFYYGSSGCGPKDVSNLASTDHVIFDPLNSITICGHLAEIGA